MTFLKNYFLPILMLIGVIAVVALSLSAPVVPVVVEEPIPQQEAVVVPAQIEGKVVQDYNQPQALPLEPLSIITQGGAQIDLSVEVADTPRETSVGMMFRNTVPQNTGMLFLFDELEERIFWMKNTFVPLDIIFIGSDKKIMTIKEMVPPFKLDQITSDGLSAAVLEIGGGQARALGINAGDQVVHPLMDAYIAKALENYAPEEEGKVTAE